MDVDVGCDDPVRDSCLASLALFPLGRLFVCNMPTFRLTSDTGTRIPNLSGS
jgi:hypothetical protein